MNKRYSIVDIETTGGRSSSNKITEVAIINLDGDQQVDSWSSLLNPERSIPMSITRLTGIDNKLVRDAPKFFEIAKKIVEMTEGRIFVAHNVFFDYNFIKQEFSELGYQFKREKLCTVRLARKLIPGHKSYSLGRISNDLGISIKDRHRAMGDAQATVELFKLILQRSNDIVPQRVHQKLLPSNINIESIDKLPHKIGVYYFYDELDTLLYIGKSIDIKNRVYSHFRVDLDNHRDISLKSKIVKIKYKLMGSELAALLYEASEIKQKRPEFNRSLKKIRFPYAISLGPSKTQELLLKRTSSGLCGEHQLTFGSKKSADQKINSIYKSVVGHAADSLFFEQAKSQLIETIGVDDFNSLLKKSIQERFIQDDDFFVQLSGRRSGEKAFLEFRESYPSAILFTKKGDELENAKRFDLFKHQEIKNIAHGYILKHQLKTFKTNQEPLDYHRR